MKRNFKILALFVICLCAIQGIFGQRSADSKELRELQTKAQELRRIKSYRITTTTEVFDETGTTLKYKYQSVSESIPPDRYRYEMTYISDGLTKKSEVITIGEKRYVRKDDEAWKLDESEPEYGVGVGNSSNVKLVEETTFNGQRVKIYQETTRSYSDAYERSSIIKYWFNTDGELLKTEDESKDEKTKNISRSVAIYQYDPNIKIEAPIK